MSNEIQAKIRKVLEDCGAWSSDAAWQVQGTWCIKHKALEIVAAASRINFETPHIIEQDSLKCVSMVVTGHMGDRSEWSIGECSIQNYKAFENAKMAAYPWAMAEKRAKDRVILKLVGLHGYAFSEDEADDFKAKPPAQNNEQKPGLQDRMIAGINSKNTADELEALLASERYKKAFEDLSEEGKRAVAEAEAIRRNALQSSIGAG